ncbi:WD40-repeat-containing domain protein [Myxozyma melibiosi]|uniref:WD40-repeat-containing domain protein n=1 Tax=Myxozyma melibiosi TaxID=54550 RepID=A0ABR1FDU2_9ASCO
MALQPDELLEKVQATRDEIAQLKEKVDARREELHDTDLRREATSIDPVPRPNLRVRQTLKGHIDKISAMHWSTNRRNLVSASQDGKLIVWDAYTGNKVHAIPLRSTWVMSCAYSPSGNLVASGGLENVCSIYSLNSGSSPIRTTRELTAHVGYISCMRFLSDQRILTASGDKTCILWDIPSGAQVQEFTEHLGDVMSVDICPTNSNVFVSGACDAFAKVWDMREGGKSAQTFRTHKKDINAVQFFPDGRAFATGSDDGTCRLYDLRADRELMVLSSPPLDVSVTSIAFSHSGRLLFAGYENSECRIWDVLRGEKVGSINGHQNRISCLGMSNDGMSLCTGSWDATLKIWTL